MRRAGMGVVDGRGCRLDCIVDVIAQKRQLIQTSIIKNNAATQKVAALFVFCRRQLLAGLESADYGRGESRVFHLVQAADGDAAGCGDAVYFMLRM